ncbi:APC family permease [Dermacoccus nishinomiyaensis]|nr:MULTISPECIES: APC family permease [Dermacoccus]QQY25212.1 APC family permease [Dermacoccus nishinomiyaensis]TCJ90680.1 amino acid/polyamine/organocation transporter (APC superfamily) [Dermacoccus sp. SAI-028]STD17712.1 Serine/threonine exchanger SteT [Dermacoccus nishinomiyaensis]
MTAEAPIEDKGLKSGSLGLLAVIAIGISTIAPAYAMTSSLGPTALEVGKQVPAVLLLGFIPMFFVAMGYKELNDEMPDSGTTFTWASRAFGPYVGWMGGWGFLAANIIVLSNLAGVAVDFFYAFLGQVFSGPHLADLAGNTLVNVVTCLAFMGISTWLCLRGVETTKWVQYVLLGFQLVVLLVYAGMAIYRAAEHGFPAGQADLSWFDPLQITDFGAFSTAMSLSIFLFWGWDLCLTLSEETKGGGRTAGWGATITALSVLAVYLLLAVATIMFSGTGDTGNGLANPDNAENVFLNLSGPVMGPLAFLLTLSVLSSSASSLQATMGGPSRALFAMSYYKALPPALQRLNLSRGTPSAGILTSALVSGGFYVVMRLISQNVLNDTITALGMMVCFYYAVTAFACVWYFRRRAHGLRARLMRTILPLLGGVALAVVFFETTVESWNPAFGSGSSLGGVGLVFVIGVGILALGLLVMLAVRARYPQFFREGLTWSGRDAAASLDEATS